MGGFIGVSGGFAGGEVGLKRFAESGKAEDIDLRQKGSLKGRQPQSPLAIAFGLGGTAAVSSRTFLSRERHRYRNRNTERERKRERESVCVFSHLGTVD